MDLRFFDIFIDLFDHLYIQIFPTVYFLTHLQERFLTHFVIILWIMLICVQNDDGICKCIDRIAVFENIIGRRLVFEELGGCCVNETDDLLALT